MGRRGKRQIDWVLPRTGAVVLALSGMEGTRPYLIDTHVHLDAAPLGNGLAEEVHRARRAGVRQFVLPGVRRRGWGGLFAVAAGIPGALVAPGLHPLAAGEWDDDAAAELAGRLRDPLAVALGEIGLDPLAGPPAAVQEVALRGQLRLAVAAGLPVLVHCRRSFGRLLAILREEGSDRIGGILHAYSGSVETALEAAALGFAVGIGGAVTWPGARRLPETVRRLPAEALVLETDAPDLPPHPHRGETNRPAYLELVARRVAELRGWDPEETARITSANARRVLRLELPSTED